MQVEIVVLLLLVLFSVHVVTVNGDCPDLSAHPQCNCTSTGSAGSESQVIDCSGHGLTNAQMDAIITTLSGSSSLAALQVLNMSGNALMTVPSLITLTALNNVDMSNNSLTFIDPTKLPAASLQFFNATLNPSLTFIDFSATGWSALDKMYVYYVMISVISKIIVT